LRELESELLCARESLLRGGDLTDELDGNRTFGRALHRFEQLREPEASQVSMERAGTTAPRSTVAATASRITAARYHAGRAPDNEERRASLVLTYAGGGVRQARRRGTRRA
jgi:hypothetical protein